MGPSAAEILTEIDRRKQAIISSKLYKNGGDPFCILDDLRVWIEERLDDDLKGMEHGMPGGKESGE